MTLILKSDFEFEQIGSLWKENDKSEYFGEWRYIDKEKAIIETTIYGELGGHIWTATPRNTFRIKYDKLIIE